MYAQRLSAIKGKKLFRRNVTSRPLWRQQQHPFEPASRDELLIRAQERGTALALLRVRSISLNCRRDDARKNGRANRDGRAAEVSANRPRVLLFRAGTGAPSEIPPPEEILASFHAFAFISPLALIARRLVRRANFFELLLVPLTALKWR